MAKLTRAEFKTFLSTEAGVARFSYSVTLTFFLAFLVIAAGGAALKDTKVVDWAQELSIVCLILSGVIRSLALSVFYSLKKEYVFAFCTIAVVAIFVIANAFEA